jgi:pantoate kinase
MKSFIICVTIFSYDDQIWENDMEIMKNAFEILFGNPDRKNVGHIAQQFTSEEGLCSSDVAS